MRYKDLYTGDIWRYVGGVAVYQKLSNGQSVVLPHEEEKPLRIVHIDDKSKVTLLRRNDEL